MFGWFRRRDDRVVREPFTAGARAGVVSGELSRREAIVGVGVAAVAAGKLEFKTSEVPVPRQTAEVVSGWGPCQISTTSTELYLATVARPRHVRSAPYIEEA